jgi:hypothetical protein
MMMTSMRKSLLKNLWHPINLEEEYEEYGLHPMFSGLYPNEDDQLEDEKPTDGIADYEEDDIADDEDVDEDLPGEV